MQGFYTNEQKNLSLLKQDIVFANAWFFLPVMPSTALGTFRFLVVAGAAFPSGAKPEILAGTLTRPGNHINKFRR
jgi:hypothetical protein